MIREAGLAVIRETGLAVIREAGLAMIRETGLAMIRETGLAVIREAGLAMLGGTWRSRHTCRRAADLSGCAAHRCRSRHFSLRISGVSGSSGPGTADSFQAMKPRPSLERTRS